MGILSSIKKMLEDRKVKRLTDGNVKSKDVESMKRLALDEKSKISATERQSLILEIADLEFYKIAFLKFKNLRTDISFIKETGNSSFMIECIKEDMEKSRGNKKIEYYLEEFDNRELEKLCIKDNELDISNMEKIKIILKTDDQEFMNACLNNSSLEFSKEEREILSNNMIKKGYIQVTDELLKEIVSGDVEKRVERITGKENLSIIEACIDKKELLGLENEEITQLVKYVGADIKNADRQKRKAFIKRHINNPEINLEDTEKQWYIQRINDLGFTIEMIKDDNANLSNESRKKLLLEDVLNPNYMSEHIRDLTSYEGKVIGKVLDPVFLNKCFNNKSLDMSNQEIKKIVFQTLSPEVIDEIARHETMNEEQTLFLKQAVDGITSKQFIDNLLRNKNVQFTDKEKIVLIKRTGDSRFIKECVYDNSLDISSKEKSKLILELADVSFIEEAVKDGTKIFLEPQDMNKLIANSSNSFFERALDDGFYTNVEGMKLKIPEGMNLNIEMEMGEPQNKYKMKNIYNWKIQPSKDYQNGARIKSNDINSKTESEKEISYYSNMLERVKTNDVGKSKSLISIENSYFDSTQEYKNLIKIWCANTKIIGAISNDDNTSESKIRVSEVDFGKESFLDQIDDKKSLDDYILKLSSKLDYKIDIHFNKSLEDGERSIVFSNSDTTINAKELVENINLISGIVNTSKNIAKIQSKDKEQMTDDEVSRLKLFEEVVTYNPYDIDKLESFLKLVIEEEDRDTYKKRYSNNKNIYTVDKNNYNTNENRNDER